MSALSIRKLPRLLAVAIEREARRQGRTKTEITLEALAAYFHLNRPHQRTQRLRQFFGRWTPEEYRAFKKATEPFDAVEEDLWR